MTSGTELGSVEGLIHCLNTQEAPEKLHQFFGDRSRVIVIAGPTASGKTALSLALAEKIGGEVISADCMQIYSGMDIGTAKATDDERARVPHHMIDIRDVHQGYSVAEYYEEAREACRSIIARGRVPIVVGGSGFYIHSFIYGPPQGPAADPAVRAELEAEMRDQGVAFLYTRLSQEDPDYAKTITCHDKNKIIRALEIITLSGRKVSDLDWRANQQPIDYDFRCWFLYRPREVLYERINSRCEQMVAGGLIHEVERLKAEGLMDNPSAANAIGYRQTLDYVSTPQDPADSKRFMDGFKKASRHYAKRQLTWFRKEPNFRWVDVEEFEPEAVESLIINDYNSFSW